ncbi:MAG TPA: hypothetical protein VIJ94_01290 [Caulobacteraceae bacterium]
MTPQAQAVLAAIALIMLGILTGCMVFAPVPQGNQQLVTFALGALSGALTFSGAGRITGKVGPAASVQSPQPSQEQQP